jgi:HAMP domain-containing protein
VSEIRPGDSGFLRRARGASPLRRLDWLRLWGRGGIRARVGMAMLLSLTCLVPAASLGVYYFGQMRQALLELARLEVPLTFIGERIALEALAARRDERAFVAGGSPGYLEDQQQALKRIEGLLVQGEALGVRGEGRFARARDLLEGHRAEVLALSGPRRLTARERSAQIERVRATSDALVAEGRALAEEGWKRTAETRERAVHYTETAQRDLLLALCLTAALLLYLLFNLPRRLVQPLRRQVHALQQAAQGEYKIGPLPRPGDEIGELSVAIERLLTTVRTFDGLKAARIHELEERFRRLAMRLDFPIAWLDQELTIRFHNPAFAAAAGALAEGARIGAVFGPEAFEVALRRTLRHRDPGELPLLEPVSPAAAGARFRAQVEAIHSPAGEPGGFLLTLDRAEPWGA